MSGIVKARAFQPVTLRKTVKLNGLGAHHVRSVAAEPDEARPDGGWADGGWVDGGWAGGGFCRTVANRQGPQAVILANCDLLIGLRILDL